MLSTRKNTRLSELSTESSSVLLVSRRDEDQQAVQVILQHREQPWTVRHCDCAGAAVSNIRSLTPGVVLCDRVLPDGGWKDIMDACHEVPKPPLVVVFCDRADERLWADVLKAGGFDVVSRPFQDAEVNRTMFTAWQYLACDSAARPRHVA